MRLSRVKSARMPPRLVTVIALTRAAMTGVNRQKTKKKEGYGEGYAGATTPIVRSGESASPGTCMPHPHRQGLWVLSTDDGSVGGPLEHGIVG